MKVLMILLAICAMFAIATECKTTENRKEQKIKTNDKADTESLRWSLKS